MKKTTIRTLLATAGLLALSGALVLAQNATTAQTMMHKGYVEYSKKAFDDAAKLKRVLFFHASWCPNCRGAEKDIVGNSKDIPNDLVIFKTNYDNETALKKTYGITTQHSFVFVDAKGMAFKKWTGGGLKEILENTKTTK